jgi:hypothetical protein
MIAKTLFFTKTLCTYAMRNLRQELSLRDHAVGRNGEMSEILKCAAFAPKISRAQDFATSHLGKRPGRRELVLPGDVRSGGGRGETAP